MIRMLVTGRHGQVAASLTRLGKASSEITVLPVGRPEFDLGDPVSVKAAISDARPDIVVNAAAYTAVDKAEQEEALATAINCDGAAAAAAAAQALGVPFIQLSTDYVYAGDSTVPYSESDPVGPLGAYGRSKLAGEIAVRAAHGSPLILRTSWVYSPFGSNFVRTMLRIGGEREVVSVVDDQHGNPTSALDLAVAILRLAPALLADPKAGGTYHLCGSGEVSWCGFAREIFRISAALGGPQPRVKAIATADYPTPARRPANSRMSTAEFQRRFGFALRPWPEAAAETVRSLLNPDR